MKGMVAIEYVLCVRVEQQFDQNIIQLLQEIYIVDKWVKYGVENCKAIGIPMCSITILMNAMAPTSSQGRLDMEKYPNREAVGLLLWIANGKRPDVAFAVFSGDLSLVKVQGVW